MECYSPFKGKEILTRGTAWMNLENMMPRKTRRTQKDSVCVSPLRGGAQSSRRTAAGDEEEGDELSVWGDEKVLRVDGGDGGRSNGEPCT